MPTPRAVLRAQAEAPAPPAAETHGAAKIDYIEQMRAAGYTPDLDKLIAMKIQGVTPEYARALTQVGLGKPSADELVAMKIHGVTPEYIAKMRDSGIGPESFDKAVAFKIFNVSPEYLAELKSAGIGTLDSDKLIAFRVQGVTPEFAKEMKQQFPSVTPDELISMRIFHIDRSFITSVKKHGLDVTDVQKLIQLRISGLLPDEESK